MSRERGAEKLEAGNSRSRQLGAGKLGTERSKLKPWKLETGNWKQGTGSRELGAGNWNLFCADSMLEQR